MAIVAKGSEARAKPNGRRAGKSKPSKQLDSAGVAAEQREDAGKGKIENWADRPDSEAYQEATKLYDKIHKCYENKQEQSDNIEEFWSIFNAKPDENAQYTGNSTCYIPTVRDAIKARMKRCLAQLFPANHKHVEAVGPTGESPTSVLSLLEHYIRQTNLKNIVRADLIAGDVTGQWNLYIDWRKSYRRVTEIVRKPPIVENIGMPGLELTDVTADDEDRTEDRDIVTEGPDIVALCTEDLAVYPPTVGKIEDAKAVGVRLRMSKEKIEQLIEEGVFVGVPSDELVDRMGQTDGSRESTVPPKRRTHDAGIRTEGTYKYCLIYEVATDLTLDGKRKEPALVYYAGKDEIVGIIRSPWWSGRRPVVSAPIEEITGSFFGNSEIEPVKFLQWNLNDFWNIGMDSAQYALLPITMTDPAKNPQYQSMVMGLAAVWLADPNSTKFASFPPLWKDAMQLCNGIKQQIYESMDVTEAMLGKMPQGRKNASQVGNLMQEQQVNITDHAKRYEDMILNPVLERMAELDQQFRTDDITVQTTGEVGVKAMLKPIAPQQFGVTWFFRWLGTAFVANAQRIQQMIAAVNVARGIPPAQYQGRRLDMAPVLEFMFEHAFGPELAPRVFVDERDLYTIPPEIENDMLANGLPVEIHPGDDHVKHIQSHNESAKITTDPAGMTRTHIMAHMKALQAQMQQTMGQHQGQAGGQGGPGGAPPGGGAPGQGMPGQPGVAGTPRIGAQPGQPRMQQPPGAVHPDAMLGAMGRG